MFTTLMFNPSQQNFRRSPGHAGACLGLRPSWPWAVLALGVLFSGCKIAAPPTAIFQGDAAAYNRFLTPTPLVPFMARGSLFLRVGERKESGNFLLTGTDRRRLRVQMLARVTGSLALELQLAEERLLFLDFLNDTYFDGANSRDNRIRLFHTDLSTADFLLLVTGRIPRAEFEAAGGTFPRGGSARMTVGDSRYIFTLNSKGLVRGWTKERQAKVVYRVEYGPYLLVPTTNGQTLRVPHRVRVYTDQEKPTMVLGIAEFKPGARQSGAVNFDLPSGRDWQFKAPPDPRMKRFDNL